MVNIYPSSLLSALASAFTLDPCGVICTRPRSALDISLEFEFGDRYFPGLLVVAEASDGGQLEVTRLKGSCKITARGSDRDLGEHPGYRISYTV